MRTEDGCIVQECLNGEPGAFGILVDKYKAGIYAFVYDKLRDFHDAQDVTQEVFLQAYRNLHSLRKLESFSFWLYRIAYSYCKRFARTESRRLDSEFIEDQDTRAIDHHSLSSYRDNQTAEKLWEAIDSLPDTYREVLALHYFGGMNSNDIASALGISPTAVRMRISRARVHLRKDMADMVKISFEKQKPQESFTFQIVEMVKKIKVQPAPKINALPIGGLFGAGLIIAILSLGMQTFLPIISNKNMGSQHQIQPSALNKSEIPIDIIRVSETPSFSMQPGLELQRKGDTWAGKADMPTARHALSASAVNGKIYAIGGGSEWDAIHHKTVEEYDPETDTWTRKADMPATREYMASITLNGKIYVTGGTSGGYGFINSKVYPYATLEEYDPQTDTWTRRADMPTARWALAACTANGKIYVIGGLPDRSGFLSTIEEYDPETDTWARKAHMPTARGGLVACTVNGKIYAIGGTHEEKGQNDYVGLSIVEEYDPETDKWTRKADMPTARNALSAVSVNGKIYAIGGQERIVYLNTLEEYDPETDKWTRKTDMPTKRCIFGAAAVKGKIYAIGGFNEETLTRMDEYDTGFADESIIEDK